MTDIKRLYFTFSALKFIHIVLTILRNYALKKKNTSHFIYQSFENVLGIKVFDLYVLWGIQISELSIKIHKFA